MTVVNHPDVGVIAHNPAVLRLTGFALGAVPLAFMVGAAGASQLQATANPSARAFAIQVAVPGQGGGSAASVSAPPDAVGVGGAFAYPADGSVVRAGSVTSGAFATPGTSATSSASAEVSSLSLFNGEVTVGSVVAKARASANGRTSAADASGSSVSGLVVLGQGVAAGPGTRVSLGDWGYAVALQQGTSSLDNAESKGARAFVTALQVRLTAEHNGLPAGTEVMVGYAEASAQAALAKRPVLRHKTAPRKAPRKAPAKKPAAKGRGIGPETPPLLRRPPPDITPELSPEGYVFPLYGPSSFGDTFGAPRGDIVSGWHHGEDIFAPLGAPILAVADGTVFSVGWNKVGGYRFWLRDRAGNEFYYAHLSAYSPAAVDGTEVEAGTVIGFVGNTGDAEGTPYHLHFEIHPVGLLYQGYDGAVRPYPYLMAWKRLEDVEFAAVAGWAPPVSPTSRAPKPGAILLSSTDISSADGLDPGSLQRVLRESRKTLAEIP
ncbi:MAG TPA: M23 family metallopeptidase [Gaiellaceae bacterium]|nr:M23 family metallopeptidase [Gaiellaceae bacterium]